MNDKIQILINRSIPPSFITTAVICNSWDKARECLNCKRIGYILDVPLRGPCPICGSNHINEITARWINLRPWWKFWGPSGYWQKLENDRTPKTMNAGRQLWKVTSIYSNELGEKTVIVEGNYYDQCPAMPPLNSTRDGIVETLVSCRAEIVDFA